MQNDYHLNVYDMQGRLILSRAVLDEKIHSFTLNSYVNGLYLIELIGENQRLTQKVLLSK